ncbi:unnamed protein product [Oikopleura dioica]|uniref:Uncharacterized protein n=1 Tax=Oikopleura dioica TaxID=34765 RepID=E4YJ63_OIKDI|nr:unnamed protein product [Oikopleura dioica]
MVDQSVANRELPKYDFNTDSDLCENQIGTVERAVCECDKMLTFTLQPYAMDLTYQRYKNVNFFRREAETNCCEADGSVLDVGTCVNDIGIAYEEKVSIYRPEYVHKDAGDGTDNDGSSSSGSSGGTGSGPGTGSGNILDDGTAEG